MANRELFPSALFPLQGDISSQAGSVNATVIGIQTVSVAATTPTDQQVLTYESSTGKWTPAGAGTNNKSVQINGLVWSDDYDIGVNLPLSANSKSPVLVNGV